jgi:metal transporter CNNM
VCYLLLKAENSHHFLRDALFNQLESDSAVYCHRPIVVRNMQTKLGIGQMKMAPERPGGDVIGHDMISVWGAQRRIVTGSDLLGRLRIATVEGRTPG